MTKKNDDGIKSALDLAMERLDREQGKTEALSDEQKAALAEIDSETKARIAEIDIMTKQRVAEAAASGNMETVAEVEAQRKADVGKLNRVAETRKKQAREGRG